MQCGGWSQGLEDSQRNDRNGKNGDGDQFVDPPALGSYPTICENVARAAALCDLEAPGWGEPWFPHCAFVDSWLTDFCMA